jgi:nicotinate-nucleotide pyrophosphorylase (carboxylating)
MHQNIQEREAFLLDFVQRTLAEDQGPGDHTSLACIPADARTKAKLLVKEPGVLAGVEVARHFFAQTDPSAVFTQYIEDGAAVSYGDIAFEVEANTQALLLTERSMLNTMQRMSGIATLSNCFLFEVEDLPVKLLDTRKTTPGIRMLEKWAVQLGGCYNYRDGLYDWIMIKDNHIDACGSISKAIEQVHIYLKTNRLDLPITVEVRNLMELYETLETGNITRVMLDNFELPLLAEAVAIVDGRFETEASGGITIHNVRQTALTGVDYISIGTLTHGATGLDLSFKIVR